METASSGRLLFWPARGRFVRLFSPTCSPNFGPESGNGGAISKNSKAWGGSLFSLAVQASYRKSRYEADLAIDAILKAVG